MKAMTKLDTVLKSKDITLPTKVNIVKAMIFSGVMYRWCERWTIKKAEHQRTDTFKLWCWRRVLRVPCIARSNQSTLKEISPEYSLERLMLKLKLQYFGHLKQTVNSMEKTLLLEKNWRQKEKRAIEDEVVGWHYQFNGQKLTPRVSEGQGNLACWSPWGSKESIPIALYWSWNFCLSLVLYLL